MLKISGKGVYGGIAIGPVEILSHAEETFEAQQVEDKAAEIIRFQNARRSAQEQLAALFDKAVNDVGEEHAAIFDIHQMMLDDLDYIEAIEGMIEGEGCNAEYAVHMVAEQFAEMFASMDDEYMQARSADVKDISKRVIACLKNAGEAAGSADGKYIIVTDDLAPSETIQLDKSKVMGFVTEAGSASSHTAILARTLGIPAVVNTQTPVGSEYQGKVIIVDGYAGLVLIDPDTEVLAEYAKLQAEDLAKKAALAELKGAESVTKSGQKVEICANIGNSADLDKVLSNDAEGIGLFRSEFIYMQSNDYPSEEAQFAIYKEVAEAMQGKRVIVRTLDIGADKQAAYFNLPHEENPALGFRAIRICLTRTEIFKTQLRALLRASAFGKIAIMFPMIISVAEVLKAKALLAEVAADLEVKGIAYNKNVEIGIMIETPAAAIMSDALAEEVDFFSVGTNDLTQYTLAIDRQNQTLEAFCDTHHPAILRLIELTVKNAHAKGVWVGICGELGADLSLTERFLQIGVDELSVSPSSVLPLRGKVRSIE